MPDGIRSRPRSNRLLVAMQRRGNSGSPAPTRHADRFVVAPGEGWGVQDLHETSGRLDAPLFGLQVKARGKAARNPVSHVSSRGTIKFGFGCCAKLYWITPVIVLDLIKQSAQCRPQTLIPGDALPSSVSIQLGEEVRQCCRQLISFCGRKLLDRRFDFLHCAHPPRLVHRSVLSKPASQPDPSASNGSAELESKICGNLGLRCFSVTEHCPAMLPRRASPQAIFGAT